MLKRRLLGDRSRSSSRVAPALSYVEYNAVQHKDKTLEFVMENKGDDSKLLKSMNLGHVAGCIMVKLNDRESEWEVCGVALMRQSTSRATKLYMDWCHVTHDYITIYSKFLMYTIDKFKSNTILYRLRVAGNLSEPMMSVVTNNVVRAALNKHGFVYDSQLKGYMVHTPITLFRLLRFVLCCWSSPRGQ